MNHPKSIAPSSTYSPSEWNTDRYKVSIASNKNGYLWLHYERPMYDGRWYKQVGNDKPIRRLSTLIKVAEGKIEKFKAYDLKA